MSRAYNPAIAAYRNMDIDNLPKMQDNKETGLLGRKNQPSKQQNLNYKEPAVRVAKQFEVLRRHRNEIKESNGTAS